PEAIKSIEGFACLRLIERNDFKIVVFPEKTPHARQRCWTTADAQDHASLVHIHSRNEQAVCLGDFHRIPRRVKLLFREQQSAPSYRPQSQSIHVFHELLRAARIEQRKRRDLISDGKHFRNGHPTARRKNGSARTLLDRLSHGILDGYAARLSKLL